MSCHENLFRWIEVSVNDMKRATKFYETAFDIQLSPPTEMESLQLAFFPLTKEAPGISGALVKGGCYTPSHQGTLVYFGVKAIDAALEKIEKAGGKTMLPRKSIGQYGFIAIFQDSEGNRMGLHEAAKGCGDAASA